MNLSELVSLKYKLEREYDLSNSINSINHLNSTLYALSRGTTQRYHDLLLNSIAENNRAIELVYKQKENLQFVINEINSEIEKISAPLLEDQCDLELRLRMTHYEVRSQDTVEIKDEIKKQILERIRYYTDWHFACLEFGCKFGEYTEYLVAGDPLYIIDFDQRYINHTVALFNQQYQYRLRPYTKGLKITEPTFKDLPQNQFGFIFSWDCLNFLSLTTAKYYLPQLYDLLRPGGVLMFKFNDGDTPKGAEYAMTRWNGYQPKSLLLPICQEIGFELVTAEEFDFGVVSWMELRKPGSLNTSKAHQALGAIKYT